MKPPTDDKIWNEFRNWCWKHKLTALPAHPWTIAAYVGWCGGHLDMPAIKDRLTLITRVHLFSGHGAPDRNPTVARTLRQIDIRQQAKPARSDLFDPGETGAPGAPGAPAEAKAEDPNPDDDAETSPAARRRGWGKPLRTKPRLVRRRR